MLKRARTQSGMRSCQSNLKQLALAFKMYANESPGERWPPRSPIPGNWGVDVHKMYPEYVYDLNLFICPSSPRATVDTFTLRRNREHPGEQIGQMHPDCVSSEFYIYLGHAVNHDEVALALYQASREVPPEALGDLEIQVEIPGFDLMRAGASGTPVMWERIPERDKDFPHGSRGINVLHMDGSAIFVEYDPYNAATNFPATYISAQTFCRDAPRLSGDCY